MPWTNKIIRSFQTVPINPSETDFHGPYNKLLYTLFPWDTDYTVVPHYVPGSVESLDPIFRYEVLFQNKFENKTVFILDLKPPRQLFYISQRGEADQHIRRRLGDLKDYSPLAVLHAVSAFGTKLCFYKMCRDQPIEPRFIPVRPELRFDTSTTPQERWDCDILEDEGEVRFKSVVEEIKQACAAL